MAQINRGKALRLLKPTRRAAKVDTAESCGQTRKQRVEKNVQRGAVMSNNKQSSVEWLWSVVEPSLTYAQKHFFSNVIEQAKAMHKEEIIDSFGVGCQVEASRLIGYHKMAEEYYNETYGGNNEQQ